MTKAELSAELEERIDRACDAALAEFTARVSRTVGPPTKAEGLAFGAGFGFGVRWTTDELPRLTEELKARLK